MSHKPETLQWRRASCCASGTCVEVAKDGDHFLVRDAKNPDGAMHSYTAAEWNGGACVTAAKVGERYLLRDSKAPDTAPLSFSEKEWQAFVTGVKAGDFSF